MPITLADVEVARRNIAGTALRTPLVPFPVPGAAEVWLKLENLQPIGSFKIRGAANVMARTPRQQLECGLLTASAGNMAQGVAFCARRIGVPATIVAPDTAPATNTTGVLGLGAKCPQLARDMAGSWNPDTNLPNLPSSFLRSLTNSWGSSSYGGYWLAAAGTYCQSSPYRKLTTSSTGCPWNAPHSYSDGVVCADSASYSDFIPLVTPFSGRPTVLWSDSGYVQTTADWGWGSAFVLCGVPASAQELYKPLIGLSLYNQIVQVLNGH